MVCSVQYKVHLYKVRFCAGDAGDAGDAGVYILFDWCFTLYSDQHYGAGKP